MSGNDLSAAYERHVRQIKTQRDLDGAMRHAVGGEFEAYGIVERELLRYYGLLPEHYLVDVGCGSGRLAKPLGSYSTGPYLGTDVVAELVDYARGLCARPEWRFETVTGLTIPEEAERADMVCFFSVFTHLLHEQTYLYLEEAKRVLKPGGRIVFSFLEFSMPVHWAVFEKTVEDARCSREHPLNVFIERSAIGTWASHLGMEILDVRDGTDRFVPLPHPVSLESGEVLEGLGNLGQSICVLGRP